MKSDAPIRFWKMHCPPSGTQAQRFHAWAQRAAWERRNTLLKRTKLVFLTLAWPLVAAVKALSIVARHGRALRAQTGVGRMRQFRGSWRAAIRHFCPPLSYFKYRLYLAEREAVAGEYVWHHEIVTLLPWMNQGRDVALLADKRRFADACAAAGLPHVPVVAIYEAGERTRGGDLPRVDLFVKVTDLSSGRGAECWRFAGDAYESGGRRLDDAGLEARFRALSRTHTIMVQPRVVNHPMVARWSNGALCTVRIVTGMRRGGSPERVIGVLRMGVGAAWVDNFGAGGIAAPVDAATGRLGVAVKRDLSTPPLTGHPDTGQPIEGQTLPYWAESVELCLRAHVALGTVAMVGWDVAVTPEGPILLEANPTWGVEVLQMSHGTPLLATETARMVLSHLEG